MNERKIATFGLLMILSSILVIPACHLQESTITSSASSGNGLPIMAVTPTQTDVASLNATFDISVWLNVTQSNVTNLIAAGKSN
jgi:hypothetical protein